jgi:hypothetical protein
MAALWDSSSDTIIVSIKDKTKIVSIFSPSIVELLGGKLPPLLKDRPGTALLLEMVARTSNPQECDYTILQSRYIDCAAPPYHRGWR